MLIIRLQRVGKKNEPTFRIVLTDSKNGPKSGKFLEILGSYDSRDKNTTKINGDRVKELISEGSQLSDTVRNYLIGEKIIEGKKVNVLPKKSPIKKEGEDEVAEAPTKETSSTESEAPAEEVKEEVKTEEAPKEETPVVEEKPTEEPKEEAPVEETPKEEEKK